MNAHTTIAGTVFVTGCALLAIFPRAEAEVFFTADPSYPHGPLIRVDPNKVLPKVGTLGAGIEYRAPLGETTQLRIGQFNRQEDRGVSKQFYSYRLYGRFNSQSMVLDWRPFRGAFYTSAGVIFMNSDVNAVATTSGGGTFAGAISQKDLARFIATPQAQQFLSEHGKTLAAYKVDVNSLVSGFQGASGLVSVDLTGAITANAKIEWDHMTPYVGFGWSSTVTRRSGLLYSVDIGAAYLGRPRVEISVGGPLADEVNRYAGAAFQNYIEAERRRFEDQLARYRVLPVVAVGLMYRF